VGGGKCLEQRISSPWDVCLIEKEKSKVLLIACAGTHQVWLYSIGADKQRPEGRLVWWKGLTFDWRTLTNVAGNGKERNKNNSYPLQASFAQPSSLDYESSSQCVYLADAVYMIHSSYFIYCLATENSLLYLIGIKKGKVL
jgi:hypothetical protein